jgi:hypothetical protein
LSGEKPFPCKQCSVQLYSFLFILGRNHFYWGETISMETMFSTTIQLFTHTGEKPFLLGRNHFCANNVSNYTTFGSYWGETISMQTMFSPTIQVFTHTGEKPFPCKQCPKT